MADVHVDRARVAEVGAAPQRLQQHAPGADATGYGSERAQQLELDKRQLDGLPVALDGAARNVDHEPVELDTLVGPQLEARDLRAPEQRADARAKLTDRERLRDVVVRAELEPDHLVELVVAGREHDDRHAARGAQALADLEPVEPRQHDVEHDEVDALRGELAQRLLPVGRLDNGVSVLLEREGEHLPDGVLVVDEEDRGGRIGHRSPGAARIALGMSTARTPKARRRARRGSLERPVNARLYRSAFLLLSLPLLVLAFSVTRPTTLPAPLLPPNFDGRAARALASELATEDPDRSPGGTGQVRAAQRFRDQLAPYGLPVSADTWRARLPGRGSVRLQNLWAVAGGQSSDAIVVMAHRDDTGEGPGANDDASGTAALVELARGYAQPDTPAAQRVRAAHTIVFLSTDAGSFGGLGAKRFAERSPFHVVATINLAAIGGPGPPRIVIAGDTPRSPAASLVVTAAKRV